MMSSALVLTFHAVGETGIPERVLGSPADMRYAVSLESLEYVLSLLDPARVAPVCELSEKVEGDWVSLTFDDGFASDYLHSFPLLKRGGFRATFYVSAENVGRDGYSDAKMLGEMASSGMEIGSHGLSHRYLSSLSDSEAREEIGRSKRQLEDGLGIGIKSFAAVGGQASPREIEIAWSEGYRTFATMKPGITRLASQNLVVLRNHVQAGYSRARLRGVALGSGWALAAGIIGYEALKIPKKVLGLRRYDLLKERLWRHKAVGGPAA